MTASNGDPSEPPEAAKELTPLYLCPFCQGSFQACELVATGEPVIFHSMPPCDRFNDAEGLSEFLRDARLAGAVSMPIKQAPPR